MGRAIYTNNAVSQLAAPITTSSTSLSVSTGTGSVFPTITGADYFYATLVDAATSSILEIVKCTARTSDTLTIVRAQQNTTAHAYSIGDRIELRPTASGFGELLALAGGTLTGTLKEAPYANLASASTIDLNSVDSNNIALTGTTTVNTLTAPPAAGIRKTVRCTAAVPFASGILPGGAYTATAGDILNFRSTASAWELESYSLVSGKALISVSFATNAEAQVASISTKALTPANLAATLLGVGQTWQGVARNSGQSYTNDTGRTIAIAVYATSISSNNGFVYITVSGFQLTGTTGSTSGYNPAGCMAIIPPGATYSWTNGGVSGASVYELR